MPSKSYNELIIQYSNDEGFLHYANEIEGATLDQSLSRKAAFEGFDSGDLQIFRFLNSNTNDHIFTSDINEIAALRNDNNFVEEGVVFNLLSEEVAGSQAIHRFLNTKTGNHHYTADSVEIGTLQADGNYNSEGIIGYGGVVDAREALQVASASSTITLNQPFSSANLSGDGAISINLGDDHFSSPGFERVSMTAMSSDGTELPEYLGFNETTGQIYGYTLKEGLPSTTISVVADDGTSQITSNFTVTASDSNSKAEAGIFTEKSLAALMSIETSSVGGIVTNSPASQSTGSLQPLATASNATNLASFQANNPSIDGTGTTIAVLDTGIDLDHPSLAVTQMVMEFQIKLWLRRIFTETGMEHQIRMGMERMSQENQSPPMHRSQGFRPGQDLPQSKCWVRMVASRQAWKRVCNGL